MNTMTTVMIVFASVFGSALMGMFLRARLPDHHLSAETRDVVKLAMGLIATMAALVLGLLIASAKGTYDTQKSNVIQMSAKIAFLDRMLALYGPEAAAPRESLRSTIEQMVARMWPDNQARRVELDPSATSGSALYEAIQKLAPQSDEQRSIKAQILTTATDIGQTRWLLFQQSGTSLSLLMLIILVFWLAIIFLSFGLFAPTNGTAMVALLVAALSVSCAILLIMELDRPFGSLISIPSEPMRNALAHLGQKL